MKKSILLLWLSAALTSHGVFALDATPWQHEQSFEISASGITRLELPAETLNVSRAELQDLRLISPSGVETPYILERFSLTPPREAAVRTFKSNFIESDGGTVVEVETGSAEPIEALTLDSPAANFIKAARLEGSNDGVQWNELAKNEVLFRQPNGANRLRIPFISASYNKLRITFNDSRSQPVPFTAARVEFTRQKQALVSHGVSITRTDEKSHETVLTVNLGAANLHLAHLRLAVSDPVFSRRVSVSYTRDNNGKSQSVPVSSAVIYRVTTNDGLSTAWLDVPIHQQVPTSEITVTIDNGDSPPLKFSGLEATRQPVTAIFVALENGPWKLLTGNASVNGPRYDLTSLDQQLRQGNATRVTAGELSLNPNFKATAALPNVTPQGAEIDLAKWQYRKPIAVKEAGVIRVEFDTEVLAHSQSSFGDVRLIQDGRQIPWQLDPTNATKTLQPAVVKETDPKRPTVSIWRITMPIDSLPALRLTCTSPTELFERRISAWSKRKDSMGNEYKSSLGSAQWVHQKSGARQSLSFEFPSARVPETFFLETDNGDNPSIYIEDVKVEYAVVTLAAKLTESAPVFLYYGNDRVAMPSYDLRLVRNELLSATKQSADLGLEEKLLADRKRDTGDVSAGSPWLWVALAAVIGALLWVVAKMLPKTEEEAR
ncbi:hypothetical protein BH11VER1_BH11VER1_28850 [soil metagenome]